MNFIIFIFRRNNMPVTNLAELDALVARVKAAQKNLQAFHKNKLIQYFVLRL